MEDKNTSASSPPELSTSPQIPTEDTQIKPIKRKRGRPTKYKARYCQDIIEYFDQRPWVETKQVTITSKNGNVIVKPEIVPKHLRFLIGFADMIGVDIASIHEWVSVHEEFSIAYAHAKELYKEHLGICGSLGLFNSHFTQFLAKNTTDWTDKSTVEHEGEITSVHFFEGMLSKAQQVENWQRPRLTSDVN